MTFRQLALAALLAIAPAVDTRSLRAQTPAIDFSGVIYANYQIRSDSAARAANGGKNPNKFDLERVYLTFRMPVGDRLSVRVTTDVFNNNDTNTNGYYRGWSVRMKYAYLQWAFANDILGADGVNATARIGMLQNVVIDQEEAFWPRYLGQTGLERVAGLFASADLGAALLVTLPKKLGEIYTNIVNGPGYTTSENDRFKDFGARLTLTPLANSSSLGALGTSFAVTPWIYRGQTASRFQNGGAGQDDPVTSGLGRNRHGVFAGLKDPRLTLGAGVAERTETTEAGDNTAEVPRTTGENTGRIITGFGLVRPFAWINPGSTLAKWGVLGRIDDFKPNTSADPRTQLTVVSLFYEPTSRVSFSLDMQRLSRKDGSTMPETKTLFFHLQAAF